MQDLFKVLLKLFALVAVSANQCTQTLNQGLSDNDRNFVVNKHNDLRLQIANGQVTGQPRGINLKRMSWDDCLASEAQRIADTCEFKHSTATCSGYGWIGQNLYAEFSTNPLNPNWDGSIMSWFNEHQDYTYGPISDKNEPAWHYTQVVWADSNRVGCGYTHYKIDDPKYSYYTFYVCNYGPGGNIAGNNPYNTGDSGCENLC